MARTREFDDETVVRAARELFWEQGYASTSLPQLEAATGLSRSSLYAAYGSKRGLFQRAAQSYLAEVIGPLIETMEAPGAGAREVSEFFLAMAAVIRSPDDRIAKRGCLMVNTAMELDELDADATEMVTDYRTRVHAAIAHALQSVPTIGDPEARAEVLTVGHLGVMAAARIAPGPAATASETIAADVTTW